MGHSVTAMGDVLPVYNSENVTSDACNMPTGIELMAIPSNSNNLLRISFEMLQRSGEVGLPYASHGLHTGSFSFGQSNTLLTRLTNWTFGNKNLQQCNINPMESFGASQSLQEENTTECHQAISISLTPFLLAGTAVPENINRRRSSDGAMQTYFMSKGYSRLSDLTSMVGTVGKGNISCRPVEGIQTLQQFDRNLFPAPPFGHRISNLNCVHADIPSSESESLTRNHSHANDTPDGGFLSAYTVGQARLPFAQWDEPEPGMTERVLPSGSIQQDRGHGLS
eukprot:c13776_g1_i2 orf=1-840(-)